MNQTRTIRLRDYMDREDGWGLAEGREVHGKLLAAVEAEPACWIWRVSLEGVKRTDASFPRESVVELAYRYRGKKGFCLIDVANQDLLDNWDAAALKRDQPLVAWLDSTWRILGPEPTKSLAEVLAVALETTDTTAAKVAKQFELKLANASMKLKQLWEKGYVLRSEEVAPTGGFEFFYYRIR